jgi:CBS domain-containing protein
MMMSVGARMAHRHPIVPSEFYSDQTGGSMLEDGAFTAGDLMSRDVVVVHPETSLREAVSLMANRRVSGVPVVDADGTLVGMLRV